MGKRINDWAAATTIHGIRYLVYPEINSKLFKSLWITFMLLALVGVVYVTWLIGLQYFSALLSTVIASMNYPVSEIYFPAISVCNYNRLNYEKLDDAVHQYVHNQSTVDIENFRMLLKQFEILDFGSFDEFSMVLNRNFSSLEYLNLTEIFLFMMHKCETILIKCWWRSTLFDCCHNFSLQKTEYGLCYSINSASNEMVKSVNMRPSLDWPLRVPFAGQSNGLKLEIFLPPNARRPDSVNRPGIVLITHHPFEWPNIGNIIPSGSSTSIRLNPVSYSIASDINQLRPDQRQCILETDGIESHKTRIMIIKGLPYLRSNCIAKCRQQYMMQFCNCTIGFFYPQDGYPLCNVTGLLCMAKFNDIFNYEKPLEPNKFFDSDEAGIVCPCLPECNRISYNVELRQNAIKFNDLNRMEINVFFSSDTMIRYRTNLAFTWVDLIVSFGGIACLFLGCSLLSWVEILYHFVAKFICRNRAIHSS